ncbi:DNA-directed RNA polymerase I subunit RPA49 [Erpetoichthys calabaricus]|nr:DNA-directed RNA polymerase I subunit RPA49 [Erpetoichthys calabaricus]
MAVSAVWKYDDRREDSEKAPIVQFSNGNLRNSQLVDFALYKNVDTNNPRKKHQRILVANTKRLCYSGSNFGPRASKCNTLCKYLVGVLNKETGKMEIHDAETFIMHPVFKGEKDSQDSSESPTKTYREKVDSLIEAFGTNKQKRSLNARRLNQVGAETLHHAVTEAAGNLIEKKGISALEDEIAKADNQEASSYIPPCYENAEKLKDVYSLDEIISPAEYEVLEIPSQVFRDIKSEDILKMIEEDRSPLSVIEGLKNLPTDTEVRDEKARILWYLNQLIRMAGQTIIKHTFFVSCPHLIKSTLRKNFTQLSYNTGRIQNVVSLSMKSKITAYALALILHINDYQADLTILQRDVKIGESQMIEIAKAMRLAIVKKSVALSGGILEDHRYGILQLPLVKYEKSGGKRKRKSMA